MRSNSTAEFEVFTSYFLFDLARGARQVSYWFTNMRRRRKIAPVFRLTLSKQTDDEPTTPPSSTQQQAAAAASSNLKSVAAGAVAADNKSVIWIPNMAPDKSAPPIKEEGESPQEQPRDDDAAEQQRPIDWLQTQMDAFVAARVTDELLNDDYGTSDSGDGVWVEVHGIGANSTNELVAFGAHLDFSFSSLESDPPQLHLEAKDDDNNVEK
jgi:hypothetical protein